MTGELALRRLECGYVNGGADGGAIERQHHQVVRLARSAADEMHALAVANTLGERRPDSLALTISRSSIWRSRTSASSAASTALT